MKCKTSQCGATRRILVIAKPHYQGPIVVCVCVCVCEGRRECEMVNVSKSVCSGSDSD